MILSLIYLPSQSGGNITVQFKLLSLIPDTAVEHTGKLIEITDVGHDRQPDININQPPLDGHRPAVKSEALPQEKTRVCTEKQESNIPPALPSPELPSPELPRAGYRIDPEIYIGCTY